MYTYPFAYSDLWSISIIMLGAIFVHACFQLSVSVLTLLNAHTIARRLPNKRLLSLNFWYILGTVASIALLALSSVSFLRSIYYANPDAAIAISLTLAPLVAIATVLWYYRRGPGTQLWLPRSMIRYITSRAKKTTHSAEAFALGITTAVAELPYSIAPLAIIGLITQYAEPHLWLRLTICYALLVCLPLIFVALYVSSGHRLSSMQHWRENSKGFLKWSSALTLVLLSLYLMVLQYGVSI